MYLIFFLITFPKIKRIIHLQKNMAFEAEKSINMEVTV